MRFCDVRRRLIPNNESGKAAPSVSISSDGYRSRKRKRTESAPGSGGIWNDVVSQCTLSLCVGVYKLSRWSIVGCGLYLQMFERHVLYYFRFEPHVNKSSSTIEITHWEEN